MVGALAWRRPSLALWGVAYGAVVAGSGIARFFVGRQPDRLLASVSLALGVVLMVVGLVGRLRTGTWQRTRKAGDEPDDPIENWMYGPKKGHFWR